MPKQHVALQQFYTQQFGCGDTVYYQVSTEQLLTPSFIYFTIMKIIQILFIAILSAFAVNHAQAQTKETTTVTINGNCGMCKKTIETAANQNTAKLNWDSATQKATLTYNPRKTNVNEVLKRVADAGYDNEKFKATDAVYNNLHGCCQYDRESSTNK